MGKDIFRTVHDLLDSRNSVMSGGAVDMQGALYDDCVDDLNALRMLEPSLWGLIELCAAHGVTGKALDEVRELLGAE